MLHDSKVRQRRAITSIFRQVLMQNVRTKALAVAAVKEVAAASVVAGASNFVVLPAPAGSSSGGASSASLPTATSLTKAQKAVISDEVNPARLVDVFVDTDWLLDEVLEECIDAAVGEVVAERVDAMLARLDKLPGKLGFAA